MIVIYDMLLLSLMLLLFSADIPSEAAVTVPPQTPPVAPPAEAPVDVPTPTPAPTPNQPESSSPAFTRAMLNAERMGGEEREGSFPACYVVMAEEVIVRVEPKVDSRQLRSLKMVSEFLSLGFLLN